MQKNNSTNDERKQGSPVQSGDYSRSGERIADTAYGSGHEGCRTSRQNKEKGTNKFEYEENVKEGKAMNLHIPMPNWQELKKDFILGGTITMVVAMCMSLWLIMAGFHNMDQGHNMNQLSCKFNATLKDAGLGEGDKIVVRTPTQIIVMGTDQLVDGVIGLLVTSVLFGVFVTTLRYMGR